MLLLFETAAGYALFKVLKEDKLKEVDVRFCSLQAILLIRVLPDSFISNTIGSLQ
jgi:hypothetical protein